MQQDELLVGRIIIMSAGKIIFAHTAYDSMNNDRKFLLAVK